MYLINCPLFVLLPRKTKKDVRAPINLNWYRNAHHQVSNQAKQRYKKEIQSQLDKLPTFSTIRLEIVIYPSTKTKFDIGNIGSITEKFFLDALVESGKLEDDNYHFVPTTTTTFGDIDKQNPRVVVKIIEI